MNDKKFLLSTAAAVVIMLVAVFIYGNKSLEPVELVEKDELVVAIETDMPGAFLTEGEVFGFPCEIFEAYADSRGIPLRIVSASSAKKARKMLATRKADFASGLSGELKEIPGSIEIYETSFAILADKKTAAKFGKSEATLFEKLKGKKIVVSQGFKSSKSYDALLDSMKGEDIFISSKMPVDIAAELTAGRYDFYICEESEARLGASANATVKYIYDFEESVPVSVAFSGGVIGLDEDFREWFAEYRNSLAYAVLAQLYFETGAASRLADDNRPGHRVISPYDHVIKAVSEREGADWRFMAAIAYCESRFEADVVSKKGAKGLMQIMPVVARQFGVPDEQVMVPEVNVTLAVKLLDKIESSMKIPQEVPYLDRMALVLASYNCGIGHVTDARKLARKYGKNPNSWQDVSEFLEKKAEEQYYNDEVVRNGKFRGSRQTLAFVQNVIGRYTSYCAIAAK